MFASSKNGTKHTIELGDGEVIFQPKQ